jgi:hypothetical protein
VTATQLKRGLPARNRIRFSRGDEMLSSPHKNIDVANFVTHLKGVANRSGPPSAGEQTLSLERLSSTHENSKQTDRGDTKSKCCVVATHSAMVLCITIHNAVTFESGAPRVVTSPPHRARRAGMEMGGMAIKENVRQ